MALPKQSLPINFAKGVDTKTDPLQVNPGNFLSLKNSVFTTGGRLTKRNGYTALGTSVASTAPITYSYSTIPANISVGRLLTTYNNELLLNDAFNLYSYDGNADGWVYKGRSTAVTLSTETVAAGGALDARYMDCAYDSTTGIKTYAWYDTTAGIDGVYYSIQDTNTGQFIVNKTLLTVTGQRPHVVSISGKTFIFYFETGSSQIYALTITGRTPGSSAAVITDNNAATPNYDVDVVNGSLYIAYNGAAATTKVALLSSSLVVTNSISKGEVASNGINLFGDSSNNIWIVYNNAAATKAFIVDSTVTSTVLAPTVVDNGATAADVINVIGCYSSTQSKAFIFYDQVTAKTINFNTLTVAGTAGTATSIMVSCNISSKAWSVSGVPHFIAVHDSTLQPTYFLLNLYNYTSGVANIAAKISPDTSGPKPAVSWAARSNLISGSEYLIALGLKGIISTTTSSTGGITQIYSAVGVIGASLDFSLSNPSALVLGNNLLIASGELIMYDGANVVEHGFHIWPEGTTTANGAAGALPAGTYGYQITYEWIDNQGQLHRSAPSPVVQFVADGAHKCLLTIPNLGVTNKGGAVTINIYRTTVNGSVYYKVTSAIGQASNSPLTATVTYTDDNTDANIISNTPLYTAQELENIAAPSPKFLGNYKNRVILVPAESQESFWYSKQVVAGSPVEFNDSFALNVGTIGGNLTAVFPLDDKLILGKKSSIYYLVGTGPSPSGENNDFTDPQLINVDCGPSNFGSATIVPMGALFQSQKGIYLLDRSLGANYIGAPVAGFDSQTVYAGNLIPTTTQIRLSLSGGSMLMYDYFYNQWAEFPSLSPVSSIIYGSVQTFVTAAGHVYKESAGTYTDGASVIPIYFKTGWMNLAGLQGFERAYYFYFLAQYISSHTLGINIYYDYSSTVGQSLTITPNSADLEQWRVFVTTQKLEAFQIELTESAGSGAGFTMSGIDLVYAGKKPYPTIKAVASAS